MRPGDRIVTAMATCPTPVGDHLRKWRQLRRRSQMDLALDADISTRHLSFIETGRAQPSRGMVLHLAKQLDVPLRERNFMLLAAGFAPAFAGRALDDPALAAARRAVDLILTAHEPAPALAVDLSWNLVAANRAVAPLLEGVAASLLGPNANVLKIALHPDGMAPRIVNFAEWRAHLLDDLRRQIEITADSALMDLQDELRSYPTPRASDPRPDDLGGVTVPLQLRHGDRVLSFLSTRTVFGTAVDITLAELTLETFFPADTATAQALHVLASENSA